MVEIAKLLDQVEKSICSQGHFGIKDDVHSITKGFEVGGMDYLTKPVNRAELPARVSTHGENYLYRYKLREEVQLRTAELEESNQLLKGEIERRKETEVAIHRLRNYLANIINSMPSTLVGVDTDGRVTQWNNTAILTTGIDADAAQGKTLSDILPWMASEMDKVAKSIRTRQVILDQKKQYDFKKAEEHHVSRHN